MINFIYDPKYNIPSLEQVKKKTEGDIQRYFLQNFRKYEELNIDLKLLPNSYFKKYVVASAIPAENIIKFDFDKYKDYLILLKKRKGKLLMPDILRKHKYIFNALHHEMQHIVNPIEYSEIFNYSNSLDCYSHVKWGIRDILDEFIASYSAQKLFLIKSGALEYLKQLCEGKDKTVASEREPEKLDLFIDISRTLSAAVAESKVLCETKGKCDGFNELFEVKSVTEFVDIFNAIKQALESYSPDKYREYAKTCENELFQLLTLLKVDFDFLRELDNAM